MSLNVRFVRKDSPIKWGEDVIPAAEKRGASLNIAEFAAMVGLTSEAGQFLIGEEAGLHRSKLNAVALNNLANKRGHLLSKEEVEKLVYFASLPTGTTCPMCVAAGEVGKVERELISPKMDRETGFLQLEDGNPRMLGQSYRDSYTDQSKVGTRVTKVHTVCKDHGRAAGNEFKRDGRPYSVCIAGADREKRMDAGASAFAAQRAAERGSSDYGRSNSGGQQRQRRDNDGDDEGGRGRYGGNNGGRNNRR